MRTGKSLHIIIYDDKCNLCNACVDFLKKKDEKKILSYLPNNSVDAKKILRESGEQFIQKNTVYFVSDTNLYSKSTAIIKALRLLPYPWRIGYILITVPVFLRNKFYDWISRNRYRWFGKSQ